MEVQFCCHIKLLLIPCLVDDGVLSDWEREAIVQGHGRLAASDPDVSAALLWKESFNQLLVGPGQNPIAYSMVASSTCC